MDGNEYLTPLHLNALEIEIYRPKAKGFNIETQGTVLESYLLSKGLPLRCFLSQLIHTISTKPSCWKAQSSRRIGNFARHLLMHECVSGDERPKNEIEYYANANGRASSPQCCMRQGHGRFMPALNLFVITRKNRSAKGCRLEISLFAKRMSSDERPDYPKASFYQAPADAVPSSWKQLFYTLPIRKRELPLIAVANQATLYESLKFFAFFTSVIHLSWKHASMTSL